MFTKKPDAAHDAARLANVTATKSQAPAPASALASSNGFAAGRDASGTPSVIGPDLLITGNLQSKGEVQIEGEVQGDVNAGHIVIGERASITGELLAEDIVIRGHVMGSVRGMHVALQSSSHVEGDIFHKALAIEQGAHFEGRSRRSDDPLGTAKTPVPLQLPGSTS